MRSPVAGVYTTTNTRIHMDAKNRALQSNILLLFTAAIWGSGFVAQRAGMEHVGPFTFNAVRFLLGSLALLPVIFVRDRLARKKGSVPAISTRTIILGGGFAGITVFLGSTFQQTGIVYTTAGKAGFVTGLYMIFVPIIGIFLKHKAGMGTWLGAIFALVGLYLLSFTEKFTSATIGDLLVLIGAFFWAVHVHILGWYSPRMDTIRLAFYQCIVCSFLSFIATFISAEHIVLQELFIARTPILYSGLIVIGVAYTLQVVAQKKAHPAHAAIVLSMEAVFALIFGWMLLNETMRLQGLVGCFFMLAGMLVSQLYGMKNLSLK